MNFRFNLDKTFLNEKMSQQAKNLIKAGKKIPKSYYYQNETSIYLSTSINKQYLKVNTGLKIKPENFDVKLQTVKTRDNSSVQLQQLLNRIKDSCITEYRDLAIKNTIIDTHQVKSILMRSIDFQSNKSKECDFFDFFDDFFEAKSKLVSKNTMPRYVALRKQLKNFENSTKRKIEIEKIDKSFGEQFSYFLIQELNLTNNSISKYLKSLKCFLNYCVDNLKVDNQQYKKIKSSEVETSIFVLEEAEIERISQLTNLSSSLNEIRDIFIFSCYTGQRYSDLKRLKKQDIIIQDDTFFWRLFQFKTRSTNHIDIPLLPVALNLVKQRIIDKEDHEYVFNVISNQKMNEGLKTIGHLADIKGTFVQKRLQGRELIEISSNRKDKITTHTGRKSFITLALRKGISIQVVQKISGHADIKNMKSYIELSDTYVAKTLFKNFI